MRIVLLVLLFAAGVALIVIGVMSGDHWIAQGAPLPLGVICILASLT